MGWTFRGAIAGGDNFCSHHHRRSIIAPWLQHEELAHARPRVREAPGFPTSARAGRAGDTKMQI